MVDSLRCSYIFIFSATTAAPWAYSCNPDHATWVDDDGTGTCSKYLENEWCTRDGKFGAEWNATEFGTFESYTKGGFHAGNCPECGCKNVVCCDYIRVTGLSDSEPRGLYHLTERFVFGRPMFQSTNGKNGIWYLEQGTWMIGLTSDLNEGKFDTGTAVSNTNTSCPNFGTASEEVRNNKWSVNNNLAVTCTGKTLF